MSYVYQEPKPNPFLRVLAIICFVLAFACIAIAGFAIFKAWWTDNIRIMLAGGIFIPIGALLSALGGKLRDW